MALTKVNTDLLEDGGKLDGIEAGADVTDTANVTAAGALMDSELTAIASVKALNQGVATTDSPTFAAVTANGGVVVDNFTLDGTTLALSSGDMTLDAAGRIDLSADDSGEIRFFDGSSMYGQIKDDDDRLKIQGLISNKAMLLVGNDGGSEVTMLSLDAENAGAATFNSTIAATGSGNAVSASHTPAVLGSGSYGGGIATRDGAESGWYQQTSGADWHFYHNRTVASQTPESKKVLSFNSTGAATFNSTIAATGIDVTGTVVSNGMSTNTAGTSNFIAGVNAGNSIVSGGNYNVVVGDEAGTAITTGDGNVAVGYTSLQATTTGTLNAGLGHQALYTNTTGTNNTGVGTYALYANTTASNNTAVGMNALVANTTGTNMTAVGTNAGLSHTTGNSSTFIGTDSGKLTTTGVGNTFVGDGSGRQNTTGASNVAMGQSALLANTTGSYNTAVGVRALEDSTTASDNTALGWGSLTENTTGTGNTALGRSSLANNTTSNNNTAVGYFALVNTTGSENTALGRDAGYGITSGASNVALGFRSLYTSTTASKNVAIGDSALRAFSGGGNTFNAAIGESAGTSLTSGARNVFLGASAGRNVTTSNYGTYVGQEAGYSNVTGSNHFFGANAGRNTTGTGNTFIGGNEAGYGSGYYVTSGSKNTIIGGYNGNQGGLDIRTASNNIVLSDGDGNPRFRIDNQGRAGLKASDSALIVGADSTTTTLYAASSISAVGIYGHASYSSCGAHLEIATDSDTGWSPCYVNKFDWSSGKDARWMTFYVNGGADSGDISYDGTNFAIVNASDYRLKENVVSYTGGLEKINAVGVKSYNKIDGVSRHITQEGFIAHELKEVIPLAVIGEKDAMKTDESGEVVPDYQTVNREALIPYLVSAVQELSTQLDAALARIETLEG